MRSKDIVRGALSVAEARREIASHPPDLIVLDVMLPDGDGLNLLREIREHDNSTVVIVLSARTEETDRLAAFKLGADDYVTKPFSMMELIARIDLRLRDRANARRVLRLGEVTIDFAQQIIWRNDRRIPMTRQEARVLQVLLRHVDRPVPRDVILKEAWGFSTAAETRTLDYFIKQLRRKIEQDPTRPVHLITARNVGYLLKV